MIIHDTLCWLGLHNWVYNKETLNVVETVTRQFKRKVEAKTRVCKSCGEKQYYTHKWKTLTKQ